MQVLPLLVRNVLEKRAVEGDQTCQFLDCQEKGRNITVAYQDFRVPPDEIKIDPMEDPEGAIAPPWRRKWPLPSHPETVHGGQPHESHHPLQSTPGFS